MHRRVFHQAVCCLIIRVESLIAFKQKSLKHKRHERHFEEKMDTAIPSRLMNLRISRISSLLSSLVEIIYPSAPNQVYLEVSKLISQEKEQQGNKSSSNILQILRDQFTDQEAQEKAFFIINALNKRDVETTKKNRAFFNRFEFREFVNKFFFKAKSTILPFGK